ncbi:PP2C family serine/threonine-protein phosphatase [Streptomyces qinzhouensis]|uniref:Protein phosphatase 2C family protein n=1 Tax=Streptomyces qinzhouensis TaxID=2599401 RepID=A0A5B8JIC0_9ACTN|nr:PP2C family serine/threonine-protein phosphatase [Streptomyces qinzhouensis]QDY77530.1 protein phosphatase 2C family protein [Streptomyces qinzhouensis]
MTVITATATRKGTRPHNADTVTVHRLPGTPMVAAALVDGIGNTDDVVEFSRTAAQIAARVGARRGALLGVLAAAEMAAAPPGVQVEDGVAVVAVTSEESGTTSIAWTGDSRVYGWTGTRLVQRSTDQTMGTWLREWGGTAVTLHRDGCPDETVPTETAALVLDDYARAALGRSSIATVPLCQITDALVVLTSDGVHGQMPHDTLEALVRAHETDPQALADAIVAAARADATGYRDDATAAVIRITT